MTYTCPKCGWPMYCVSTASIPAYIYYACNCGYRSKTIREPLHQMPLPEEWQEDEEENGKVKPDAVDLYELLRKESDG